MDNRDRPDDFYAFQSTHSSSGWAVGFHIALGILLILNLLAKLFG